MAKRKETVPDYEKSPWMRFLFFLGIYSAFDTGGDPDNEQYDFTKLFKRRFHKYSDDEFP